MKKLEEQSLKTELAEYKRAVLELRVLVDNANEYFWKKRFKDGVQLSDSEKGAYNAYDYVDNKIKKLFAFTNNERGIK